VRLKGVGLLGQRYPRRRVSPRQRVSRPAPDVGGTSRLASLSTPSRRPRCHVAPRGGGVLLGHVRHALDRLRCHVAPRGGGVLLGHVRQRGHVPARPRLSFRPGSRLGHAGTEGTRRAATCVIPW